jgi:hypothetical protein
MLKTWKTKCPVRAKKAKTTKDSLIDLVIALSFFSKDMFFVRVA